MIRIPGTGHKECGNHSSPGTFQIDEPLLGFQAAAETGQGAIAGLVLDVQGQPIPEIPVTFFRAAEPGKWWRQTQTYGNTDKETDHPILVNADDQLGENFALSYVPAGEYLVKVKIGEKSYVQPVTVKAGEIGFVLISTGE